MSYIISKCPIEEKRKKREIQKLLLKMNSQQKIKQNNKKCHPENPNKVDS